MSGTDKEKRLISELTAVIGESFHEPREHEDERLRYALERTVAETRDGIRESRKKESRTKKLEKHTILNPQIIDDISDVVKGIKGQRYLLKTTIRKLIAMVELKYNRPATSSDLLRFSQEESVKDLIPGSMIYRDLENYLMIVGEIRLDVDAIRWEGHDKGKSNRLNRAMQLRRQYQRRNS